MLAARWRRNVRRDKCPRCGAGRRPALSSTLRTEVAGTLTPTPLSSPTMRRYPQSGFSVRAQDRRSPRSFERRPSERPLWEGPVAGHELAMPAQQRVRSDRKARPSESRQRATQRRQKRTIAARQLRPSGLPAEDRELVAQHKDLQLVRTAWPPQQPDQREQVPHSDIRE
jgi:hypothetical protein